MGARLSSTELAEALGVTPTRVSQYVREGKLDGCYQGDGRARRFDLDQVAVALGRRLHPGQMLGNGASTRAALTDLRPLHRGFDGPDQMPVDAPGGLNLPSRPAEAADSPDEDADRYAAARAAKAEEELRRLRRQNAEAEGKFVLASTVKATTARLMAQEIAEIEAFLRDAARALADQLGIDFRSVRKILMDQWRKHRGKRASILADSSAQVELTAEELAEDF